MMKAVVMTSPKEVIVKEIEMPVRKPGEALLKVLYAGICGTDLSSYRGTMKYIDYPRVIGHEFSAEIVEVDESEKRLKKGMIVTVNPYFNCGACYSCQRGLVNCCSTNKTMGVQREGAFSEYIAISTDRIYPAGHLDPKLVALIEPFCISLHGIKRANIQKGANVLIMGAGTIGAFAAIVALQKGTNVTVCDISEEKLNKVQRMGVQNVIKNTSSEDFLSNVKTMTNGNGFDITVEAVGLPSTFQNCIDAASFGGIMIQLGVGKNPVEFNFTTIQQKELTIMGSRNAVKEDFLEAVELFQKFSLDEKELVTKEFSKDQAGDAFRYFDENVATALKILIKM